MAISGQQMAVQPSLFSNPVEQDGSSGMTVTVYTDGGCDPNPGPGGWAAVIQSGDWETVLSGRASQTTNNRMELEAALSALAYLASRYGALQVDLYTDSEYLRLGITRWIDRWFANGWKTQQRQPVQNQELWRPLYELAHLHQVRWHWVKGHGDNLLNERVDRLVRQARVSAR